MMNSRKKKRKELIENLPLYQVVIKFDSFLKFMRDNHPIEHEIIRKKLHNIYPYLKDKDNLYWLNRCKDMKFESCTMSHFYLEYFELCKKMRKKKKEPMPVDTNVNPSTELDIDSYYRKHSLKDEKMFDKVALVDFLYLLRSIELPLLEYLIDDFLKIERRIIKIVYAKRIYVDLNTKWKSIFSRSDKEISYILSGWVYSYLNIWRAICLIEE